MLRKAMSLTLGSLLAAGLTVAVSPAGFADPALAAPLRCLYGRPPRCACLTARGHPPGSRR